MSIQSKLIWVVVAIVGIVLSSTAWAEPDLQIGSATGAPGETVTIPVTFTNSGSVVGFQFDVQFNSTQFAIGTLTDGPALSPHLRHSNTPAAGTLRVLIRPEVSPTLPNVNSGVILNISFTINSGATPGTYDLTLPSAGVVAGVGSGAYFSDKSANAISAGTLTKGQITVGTPDILVSPMALDFGAVKVGTPSTAKPVTVSNLVSAAADLVITNIEITGTNAGEFSKSGTCSSLAPGNSCTINVTFTPSSAGPKTAALRIESNDPDQGVINVALNGTGGIPDISVTPMALEFGGVKVGKPSAAKSVTVSNSGSAPVNLAITNIEITGADPGEFSKSSTCSSLAPGGSCTIDVTFTPSSASPPTKTGALKIESDDPDEGVVNVGLSGSGGTPHLLARRVILGEDFSSGIPATWTNVEAWGVGCGRVIGPPFVAPWAIVDPNCGTVTDELLYTPYFDASLCTDVALLFSNQFSHGTGTTATLSATGNHGKTWTEVLTMSADEGPGWKEVDLGGAAGGEGAQVEFAYSPSGGFWAIDNVWVLCDLEDLMFKALANTTSQPQTILITNTGTVDLSITGVDFTGTDADQFGITGGDCTGTLAPSVSCPVQVVFLPTGIGLKDEANLGILSDDSDHSTLKVPLSGKGVVLLVNPEQGTLGSQLTITGSGFGAQKGKVLVGGVALKVLEWGVDSIRGTMSKVGPLGSSQVIVQTKQKGAAPVTQDDAFSVEVPNIWRVVPDHGGVNTEVTITGKYFGTKKGKVYIGANSCKVLSWTMDATTGMSTIQFLIPKGPVPGPYDLKVVNKVGTGTIVNGFTIE